MSKRGHLPTMAGLFAAVILSSMLVGCQQQQADAVVTGQATKNVMLQNVEIYNTGNTELINTIISPTYVGHFSSMPEPVVGREAFTEWVLMNRGGYSDFKVTIDDIVVEKNRICLMWTVSGTHDGQLGELAPTGKRVNLKGLTLARVQNGQIVEEWITWNQLEMYKQLGIEVMPEA